MTCFGCNISSPDTDSAFGTRRDSTASRESPQRLGMQTQSFGWFPTKHSLSPTVQQSSRRQWLLFVLVTFVVGRSLGNRLARRHRNAVLTGPIDYLKCMHRQPETRFQLSRDSGCSRRSRGIHCELPRDRVFELETEGIILRAFGGSQHANDHPVASTLFLPPTSVCNSPIRDK